MSYQAMTWVLECSPTTHSMRLVLLALASHAHADGTNAFPSARTIAKEANIDVATARKLLGKLRQGGHIVQTGQRPSGTKVYSIVMGGGDRSPGRRMDTPADRHRGGDISSHGGGDRPPEPSRNQSENGEAAGARARARASIDASPPQSISDFHERFSRRMRGPHRGDRRYAQPLRPPVAYERLVTRHGFVPSRFSPDHWEALLTAASLLTDRSDITTYADLLVAEAEQGRNGAR